MNKSFQSEVQKEAEKYAGQEWNLIDPFIKGAAAALSILSRGGEGRTWTIKNIDLKSIAGTGKLNFAGLNDGESVEVIEYSALVAEKARHELEVRELFLTKSCLSQLESENAALKEKFQLAEANSHYLSEQVIALEEMNTTLRAQNEELRKKLYPEPVYKTTEEYFASLNEGELQKKGQGDENKI